MTNRQYQFKDPDGATLGRLEMLAEKEKSSVAAVIRSLTPNEAEIRAMCLWMENHILQLSPGGKFQYTRLSERFIEAAHSLWIADMTTNAKCNQNIHEQIEIMRWNNIPQLYERWSNACSGCVEGYEFKSFEVNGHRINAVFGPDDSEDFCDRMMQELRVYAQKLYGETGAIDGKE